MRIVAGIVFMIAACGEPQREHDCPEVVDRYLEVMRIPAEGNRDEYVAQCRAMTLTQEQMGCLVAANDHAALLDCPVEWVRR